MFGCLFLFHMHDPECANVLIANKRERLYVQQGERVHAGLGGWLSESKGETCAQMILSDEKITTGRRLSQHRS